MKKLEYMKYAVENEFYLEREWLLRSFSIMDPTSDNRFYKVENNKLFVSIKDGDNIVLKQIEGFTINTCLFDRNEKVNVPKKWLPFIENDIETTWGIMILNLILFWYPYNGKTPYLNGEFKDAEINKIAFNLLKENKVSNDEHIKYENAVFMISCLSQCAVPSASRKSIVSNPETPKLKKRLLEENKDKLDDPAVIANIQDQLVASEKDWIKGDVSEGFFVKSKTMNVSRLKMMGMYGSEPDFFDESKITVMKSSLDEGWSIGDIPMLNNNTRGGSYSRGKETALGGESTKVTSRIFQNYRIEVDDCNTNNGLWVKITTRGVKQFIGRYLVGSNKPLTESELLALKKDNKVVLMRSPATCKTGSTSYCKKCFGDDVANNGLGLNSQTIIFTSTFMSISMAKMHSTQLKVARYNYKERIG